jgi:hypothetical protein
VNQEGQVNVRAIDRDPPTGGTIFGMTEWNENAPRDPVDDCPMFQGVRGVCAKVFSMDSQKCSTSVDKMLLTVQRSLAGAMSFMSLK